MTCTTHHNACACREAEFAKLKEQLAEKDADIERLKAELYERIKRSDIWMRSDTQAREYANRLENQLAASEARERALTDALEDACDGLACAYDDLKHCNVEECLPLVSEVVSCKSYLDEARKALAACKELKDV